MRFRCEKATSVNSIVGRRREEYCEGQASLLPLTGVGELKQPSVKVGKSGCYIKAKKSEQFLMLLK